MEYTNTLFEIIIDNASCIACEDCVEVCPVDVYEIVEDLSVALNQEKCLGCECCVEICDQNAITL